LRGRRSHFCLGHESARRVRSDRERFGWNRRKRKQDGFLNNYATTSANKENKGRKNEMIKLDKDDCTSDHRGKEKRGSVNKRRGLKRNFGG